MTDNTYEKLADFGREILLIDSIDESLPLISRYAKEVTGAERCSIFIYDVKADKLWTKVADGIGGTIVLGSRVGIAGHAFHEREMVLVNDVSKSPLFAGGIDKKSGFVTLNVLVMPIVSRFDASMGVLQLLNKDGGFSDEDARFVKIFNGYIASYLNGLDPKSKELKKSN